MDKLQKTVLAYQTVMQTQYYFEIAKKNTKIEFVLTFEKEDFFHMAGLHKLKDVTTLQIEMSKGIIFDRIANGNITFDQVKNSYFYQDIEKRLSYLEKIQKLLDSNQIVFQYLESRNKASYIKADYLLEEGYKTDIIYIFLNERSKAEKGQIPIMCCRSFFPMNQLDYTRNQPSYTLLKKIKIDTHTGNRTVQYDRSKILEQAKAAGSESERRSVLQQLNEKKAQLAIREVLDQRKNLQKDKQDRER
ncbi:MAG: hypothetical protein K1W31_03095 [Lachnospiraceae bacterium]